MLETLLLMLNHSIRASSNPEGSSWLNGERLCWLGDGWSFSIWLASYGRSACETERTRCGERNFQVKKETFTGMLLYSICEGRVPCGFRAHERHQSTHPPITASLKHKSILILKLKEVFRVTVAGFANTPNLAYFTPELFRWLLRGYGGSHFDSRNFR